VLLGVEGRERVRDARNRRRVSPLVSDREGHRSLTQAFEHGVLDLELDVPAHVSDGGLEGGLLPQLSIKVETFDQFRQPSTAQNFLADRIEPELDGTSYSRPDERLRDLLSVDDHSGRGPIDVRQEGDEGHAGGNRHREY